MSGSGRFRALRPQDETSARQANEADAVREGSASRCTGTRPRCRRCSDNDVGCEYDADPDTTTSLTVKRRNIELLKENQELRQVVSFMAMRPWQETEVVFRRLREGMDPLEVFATIISTSSMDIGDGAVVVSTLQQPLQALPHGESRWDHSSIGLRSHPAGAHGPGEVLQQKQPQQQQQAATDGKLGRDATRLSERLDIASLLT